MKAIQIISSFVGRDEIWLQVQGEAKASGYDMCLEEKRKVHASGQVVVIVE